MCVVVVVAYATATLDGILHPLDVGRRGGYLFLLDGCFTVLETGAPRYRLHIETLAAKRVSEG